MLVVVTLLWGLSFPLTKSWQGAAKNCPGGELLASSTLIAVRMFPALLLLVVCKPRLLRAPTRREHLTGAIIGLAFWAGFTLQVWGLARTTPALSGFITSLASAWVPLLALVFLRIPVAGVTLLGLGLGVAGTAVLGIDTEAGWKLGGGEGRTLLATGLFAIQILLLDRLGKRVRSEHLTVAFLAVTGLLGAALVVALAVAGPGLGAWLSWLIDLLSQGAVARDVILLIVLPTVLAFHWMNVYQPHVSAGRAALIYLLEPVFATVFSVMWGYDPVTVRLFLGGGLILAGNLLIEVPYWVQRRRSRE
jgi:drug/metabolite transporter (DMT)-like permease